MASITSKRLIIHTLKQQSFHFSFAHSNLLLSALNVRKGCTLLVQFHLLFILLGNPRRILMYGHKINQPSLLYIVIDKSI